MASAQPAGAAPAPRVNLFDVPELLPGAQPSANPAQREEFEQRCRQLHADEEYERREQAAEARAAAGTGPASANSELEAMFPNLDASLVHAIRADAPTAQAAIETLLALSAAAANPAGGDAEEAARVPDLPPRDVGVEDHEKFPALMDAGGWQVGGRRAFDHAAAAVPEADEELGSAWRDRAKAAADIVPEQRPAPAPRAWGPQAAAARRRREQPKDGDEGAEQPQPLTDWEFRQKAGQRRAKHRALYGRGGRGGRGVGRGGAAGAAGAVGSAAAGGGEESESEVSEDSEGA